MTIRLGTNISSLRAQRQLNSSAERISSVFERLSSGQRINRASDDAAGLAIADSLRSQRRVFTQGLRNIDDGISVLAIADGALSSLSEVVTRLTELAEQAANGVLGGAQRAALDEEAQSLAEEFSRIVQSTTFNGINLLTDELSTLQIQAGTGTDAIVSADLGGAVGSGNFNAPTGYAAGSGPRAVDAADFNNDGHMDLVTADYLGDTVSLFLGDGTGSFSGASAISAGNGPISITSADVNLDGNLDLVTANFLDSGIGILLGNGDGSFGAVQTFAGGAGARNVITADFNGDGLVDIASADYIDDSLSIFMGDGSGNFSQRTSFSSGNGTYGIAAADFNNDGILDLATADYLDDTTSIFLGDGSGGFGARTTYSTGTAPTSVASADLNGDGNADLAVGDVDANSISILLGDGSGGFSAGTPVDAGASTGGIVLQDMNSDGLVDMIASNDAALTVTYFEGAGNGTFNTRKTFATTNSPDGLLATDVNNDGALDLVTAENSGSTMSVLTAVTVSGTSTLAPFSLGTMADAKQALPVFQRKQDQLASQRGQIGASESRLLAARNALEARVENTAAAEARIRDSDVAAEAAKLVRESILQQAATAVLSQTNQLPALALQLLA